MEFKFAFQLQYTSFKLNLLQTNTIHIMDNIIMCLCILLHVAPFFVDVCAGNSASKTVITPEGEDHR